MKMLNRLSVEQQTSRWKQTTRYTARYSPILWKGSVSTNGSPRFSRTSNRPFEFQRMLDNCSYLLFAQIKMGFFSSPKFSNWKWEIQISRIVIDISKNRMKINCYQIYNNNQRIRTIIIEKNCEWKISFPFLNLFPSFLPKTTMKKCRNYVQKSLFNSRTSNSYINIHVRLYFEKAKFLLFSIFHQQRNYRNPIDINFPNPVYRNSIKVIHVYRRFMNISLTREPSIPNFRPIIHTKESNSCR